MRITRGAQSLESDWRSAFGRLSGVARVVYIERDRTDVGLRASWRGLRAPQKRKNTVGATATVHYHPRTIQPGHHAAKVSSFNSDCRRAALPFVSNVQRCEQLGLWRHRTPRRSDSCDCIAAEFIAHSRGTEQQ